MAINKNHEFEDLEGIKCAIVARNVAAERAVFLKNLLTYNGYSVVITEASPPKVAPEITPPTTYTVGVTDVRFNATNAIFARQLKTPDGKIVSPAYWQQQTNLITDAPYFE